MIFDRIKNKFLYELNLVLNDIFGEARKKDFFPIFVRIIFPNAIRIKYTSAVFLGDIFLLKETIFETVVYFCH